MHRLAQYSKPSKTLVMTQLLNFKAQCESNSVKFVFVHKFLVKLIVDSEIAYFKINVLDMEFYFISRRHELMSFTSVHTFAEWFKKQYFKGDEDNES